MKVIWLCNCPITESDLGATGTWLGAMARGLRSAERVELGIVALGPVDQFIRLDYQNIKQWIVPSKSVLNADGLPAGTVVQSIVAAVKEFAPDVIHCWGTETFLGLLSARRFLPYPALLLIQGLKGQIAKVFFGGLTVSEQMRCLGIKEFLTRRSIYSERRAFARWSAYEQEIIRGHRFIDAQSGWGAAQIRALNSDAHLFSNNLVLRESFSGAGEWKHAPGNTIYCTAAYASPFKGLHVAIRAMGILKRRMPDVHLRIAGAHQRNGLRQSGYMRWVNRIIRKLDLRNAVDWLGPLNADQIVAELKRSSAVVIPTFIETYCVALAEAMSVGTPVVSSFAGGTPSLGKDDTSCLYFSPGDSAMCAYQLERILTDADLATRLSRESRKIAAVRSDSLRIVEHQLEIYRSVVEMSQKKKMLSGAQMV